MSEGFGFRQIVPVDWDDIEVIGSGLGPDPRGPLTIERLREAAQSLIRPPVPMAPGKIVTVDANGIPMESDAPADERQWFYAESSDAEHWLLGGTKEEAIEAGRGMYGGAMGEPHFWVAPGRPATRHDDWLEEGQTHVILTDFAEKIVNEQYAPF